MDLRLSMNPQNICDTKINSGATVTAVSFYFKPADITIAALPAEL
jgi:hypothetical protein